MPAPQHVAQFTALFYAPPNSAKSFLRHLLDVWSERRALERLDASALRDIGLTRAAAAREAARPPWDTPPPR